MNEIKIRKFLDKKFKETSEKENFCYEEISLIYKIKINNFKSIFDFKPDDIEILDYKYGEKVSYEVAI